jgi:hypothetical protein
MISDRSRSKMKYGIIVFVVLLAALSLAGSASAKAWYAGDDGGHGVDAFVSKFDSYLSTPAASPYEDIAELLSLGTARGTAAKANYAYALTREGNLYTFDVSDILSHSSFKTYVPIGAPLAIGKGNGVINYQDYLYAYEPGITVVDIQNPISPSIVSSMGTSSRVYNMIRSGDYLIACEKNYVEVFSLTTPSAPLKVGELFIGTEGWSAAVYGDYLYVAGGWSNPMLYVIDFSDPTSLSLLNSVPLDELPYHMNVSDNKLITSCTSSAQLWSLSDPLNPSELDSISIPWSGRVFAQDNENLIFNGKVYSVGNLSLDLVQTFDTHGGGQHDGFPYGSDVTYNEDQSIIFLAQSERVLILRSAVDNPVISLSTDKATYQLSDTMTITIDIANPIEDSITFQWYWAVPQFSVCVPVMSVPISAGYDDTLDYSFTVPDWGSTPFGNVFYVQLLDASGEVLDADATWWAYSPSAVEAMPVREVDVTKEIMKTIERVELPS